jgi:cytochrome c-type biogenesis protein CcmH/NrfG
MMGNTMSEQRKRRGIALCHARALAGALGLVLLGTCAPAWAQKSPTARAALERAVIDLRAQHFAEAAAEMETAVRFEPRFAFGWYLLASSQRRAGDCDRAVAAYRRYNQLRPSHPDPHFGIGLCLATIGDREGAVASFRRYVEVDTRPEWAEFVTKARQQIEALEHARATAGAPHPAKGEAATATGKIERPGAPATTEHAKAAHLIAEHKYPEAADDLRASIKTTPADAAAWYKLAFALREANQPQEAAKAYRRYITLRPDDADPYYGLGHVLLASGHPDEALVAFRAYVKAAPAASEQRWLSKARAEIAHLESARRGPLAARSKSGATTPQAQATSTEPPAPTATHAPVQPPAAPTTPPAALETAPAPAAPTVTATATTVKPATAAAEVE